MQTTWWALLLKPFIGIVILAAMFYLPRYPAMLIRWLMPDCRLKRWLFEDWDSGDAASGSDASKGRLEK